MLVYFDESYDNDRHFLLYGALFLPRESNLHRQFSMIRKEKCFRPEVKYTRCRNPRALDVYKRVIDAFIENRAYFRCVVLGCMEKSLGNLPVLAVVRHHLTPPGSTQALPDCTRNRARS